MKILFINHLCRLRILLLSLAFIIVALFIYGGVRTLRWNAGESNCIGRLSQIRYAIQCYYQEHGSYPPLYFQDKEGNPIHSWRVLLLKYYDNGDHYNRYNFKETWNSAGNLALEKTIASKIFWCPNDSGNPDWTSYVAIDYSDEENSNVSCKAVIGGGKASSKIAIIEVHESGIQLMEPRDLSWKDALSELVRSSKRRPVNFLTADGKIGKLYQDSIIFNASEESLLRRWVFP